MKTLIVIFAYRRQKMLDDLLEALEPQLTSHDVLVMDDGSDLRVPDWVRYERAPRNHGKQLFWKWVNVALRICKQSEYERFIFLADDLVPEPDALVRAEEAWQSIAVSKDAVNLLKDTRNANWNAQKRENFNDLVFKTGWVDGCFICGRGWFAHLYWRINQIGRWRWKWKPTASSGVWEQAVGRSSQGKNFNIRRLRFFQVKETLFHHGDHPSLMNPEERKKNPIKA